MNAGDVQRELTRLLQENPLGRSLHVLEETTSTNDDALALAREGAEHGTVVLALSQTSGRGRMGRIWNSRRGDSLCFSLLLRPDASMQEAGRLTFYAGLAAHRALTCLTGLPIHIKWPNDLLWENRKICGILTESATRTGRPDHVVIGFGCNLNQTENDFPPELRKSAASLAQLTGRTWNLGETAAAILREMNQILAWPWESVLASWKEQCASLGKQVRVAIGTEKVEALLLDISPDGALLLRSSDGMIRRALSAEIL